MIYLDNNATTKVADEVLVSMLPYWTDCYHNPSSGSIFAKTAAVALRKARKTIAGLLGMASHEELIFTSYATESNNHVFHGATRANPARRHIVTTSVEHSSVHEVCLELERRGYEVTRLPVDHSGNISAEDYLKALRTDTLLISIMHANNETGVIFPVETFSLMAKNRDPGILFHTDATQSATKLPISLTGNMKHVDFLSFSGHKFHAPKGIGGLYRKTAASCHDFIRGGGQENGYRGGTENVPAIIGMACAMWLAAKTHDRDVARMERLRNFLQDGLLQKIPDMEVNGLSAERIPNTLNIACHGVDGDAVLAHLDERRICAATGSACRSEKLGPSRILRP